MAEKPDRVHQPEQSHSPACDSLESGPHPAAGGRTWSADLELGAKVHELIGEYWTQIAGASTGDRFRLLVELAGKLYDLHALKRIELVRSGHVEDASAFDTEHAIRASLAVWQPLTNFPLEDAERQAIDRALAACRSRWMGEALRKVTGAANTGNSDGAPQPGSQTPMQPHSWKELTICFLSDERVQITVGNATETRNYTEMGFANKKNGKAVQAWDVLRVFARQGGLIQIAGDSTQWAVLEKRVQEIRKTLKLVFHLTDDPIRFVKKTPKTRDTFGYHASFRISCHPSIDS